ncbi:capsule biosynthesis GfcC family protein, partial [Polaromonas sp.]|uniref:capsule biosynthesis GfcC family protein n=1 Tax=Polaromonas sp. TaxID=1869339 RepID=UPI00286B5462
MKPLPQKTPRRTAATRRPQQTLISSATFLVLGVLHGGAAADDLRLPAANVYAGANPPVSGERLSDWLQRQPAVDDAYFPGLSWLVPAEVPAQTALKNALQAHLLGSEWTFRADVQARQRLSAWIGTLPVTGRVPIPVADSRWLEVHPAQNPVLAPDHQVRVPPRPATVTVVTGDGYLCAVPHAAGHDARAYIEACRLPQDTRPVDRVWMAQPDGQVQSFGIGGWNAQKQGEPAPGAWLWAPARGAGWSDGFAKKLMAFQATQGPSAAQATASTAAADDNTRLPTSPIPASPQTPLRDP